MKKLILLCVYSIFLIGSTILSAQCSIVSTDGYIVNIAVRADAVVPLASSLPCDKGTGYVYNLAVSYTISYSGSNLPTGLWTLRANTLCNAGKDDHIFYSMPTDVGTHTGTGLTTSNVARAIPDCATADIYNLDCSILQIRIQGPGIPDQIVNCGTPLVGLPIHLLNFNGEKLANANRLAWRTASEGGNSGFFVEKSSDAQHWQSLAFVPGTPNSNSKTDYDYTDPAPLAQINYYRLRLKDNDGETTTYIIAINNAPNEATTEVYAENRTGEPAIRVKVASTSAAPLQVDVLGPDGQLVYTEAMPMNDRYVNESIKVPGLKGIYFVVLRQANQVIGHHKLFIEDL